jgi:hypothetical protein
MSKEVPGQIVDGNGTDWTTINSPNSLTGPPEAELLHDMMDELPPKGMIALEVDLHIHSMMSTPSHRQMLAEYIGGIHSSDLLSPHNTDVAQVGLLCRLLV